MLDHLSSCKSPQQMCGRGHQNILCRKGRYRPEGYRCPCRSCPAPRRSSRSAERIRSASGYPDVDIAITTRELARMIERAGLKFTSLPDEEFDSPLGEDTGAAVIFGATGGVMEAALRTANDWLTGKDNLDSRLHCRPRDRRPSRKRPYDIAGMTVKVAVASGLANAANELMKKVRSGEADWHVYRDHGMPRRLCKRRRSAHSAPVRPRHR